MKYYKKVYPVLLFISACFMISGCATSQTGATGLSDTNSARLCAKTGPGLSVDQINGATPNWKWGKKVDLPKGENTLCLSQTPAAAVLGSANINLISKVGVVTHHWKLKFNSQPGKEYALALSQSEEAIPCIVDTQTKQIVSSSYKLN